MAVRIYALAKELNVDSKELVDVCNQIGIRGKGSALASLDEDEVVKLKDHFSKPQGGGAAPRGENQAPLAPERPRQPARTGKVRVLPTPKPAQPEPTPEPASEAPPEPAEVGEAPATEEAAAEAPAVEETSPPEAPVERTAPPGRQENYVDKT